MTNASLEYLRQAGAILERIKSTQMEAIEQAAELCAQTIAGDELAPAALHRMEEKRITSLFVCDPQGKLEGIVHLHDLWGLELF